MVRSVAGRNSVAAFTFVVAAVWLGVSLMRGLECLLVFMLVSGAMRLYQLRSDSRDRARVDVGRRAQRESQMKSGAASKSAQRRWDDRAEPDWPTAGEPAW